MDIIEKLKSLLKEKGIKVNYFASRLDCTTQNIYNIFNGRTILTVEMLKKMADVLDVDVSYFFIKKNESSEKNFSNDNKINTSSTNEIDVIKYENSILKLENERLNKELDFYKHAVEMKDLFISQILEANKIKEHNSSDGKAKKSA